MRNLHLLSVLALFIGTGSIALAQLPSPSDYATPVEISDQGPPVGIQATHHQARVQPALDPVHFCYAKNEAYSVGYVLGNLKCSHPAVVMLNDSNPLVWTPVARK